MNANDCRVVRLEIDGSELEQQLSDLGEAHVEACASCAQFRAERASLRALVGSLRPVSAPADFDMRLRARIAREKDQPRQPFIFRFVMSTPAIAVAALAVLVLSGAIVWMNQRSVPEANNTASNDAPVKVVPAPPGNSTTVQSPQNEVARKPVESPMVATGPKRANTPRYANRPSPIAALQAADFNSVAARSVQLSPDRNGEVSVTAPENPMVLTIRDEKGGSRRVMLPPVTFGSPRLTGNRMPVSMNNSRDW